MTFAALQRLEVRIRQALSQFTLDEFLVALRENASQLLPFVSAGAAAFAVRLCQAPSGGMRQIPWPHIAPIANWVAHFLLSDPIVFDKELKNAFYQSNPVYLLLRIMGSQFPYHVNVFEVHARPLLLFDELPAALAGRAGIPSFDFDSAFRATTGGVGVPDFVAVGFVAWALSGRPTGLTSHRLEEARRKGLLLPPHRDVRSVLRLLSASPVEFREVYARFRESDRRFGMYDFNPLHVHPLIRPWGEEPFWSERGGRMIAPLPNLVSSRVSLGIYHQMLTTYGTRFTDYFGHVFAEYCGRVLRGAVRGILLSEEEIRRTYPSSRGQVPDWVVIEGQTAVLLECKATRFTRAALTTAAVDAVEDSLKQVLKGLKQLHRFREACRAGASGLEALGGCTEYLPVLLTLEPLHGINSGFFRDEIDKLLSAEGVVGLPWRIVSVEELELVERHIRGGIPLAEVLTQAPTQEVITEYERRSGMTTNADSFLFSKHVELMGRLGIPQAKRAFSEDVLP